VYETSSFETSRLSCRAAATARPLARVLYVRIISALCAKGRCRFACAFQVAGVDEALGQVHLQHRLFGMRARRFRQGLHCAREVALAVATSR